MKTKETVNSMKHKLTKTVGKKTYVITIRLSDDCKNGHNDFAITGSIYEAGKPMTDRYCLGGGAIGDSVAKAIPELKIFNDLHLCDVNGVPMCAVENGFYHLVNGFNSIARLDTGFKAMFCEYYRVTPEQFDILVTSEDKDIYAYYLEELGILDQWKAEALKAIELLEEMTGEKFKDNSTKLQTVILDPIKKAEIIARLENGFYTPEAIQEREKIKREEAKQKMFKDIEDDFNRSVEKERNEYLAKKAVLLAGLSIKNFIYYSHTNEGCFNWNTSTYNKAVTEAEFNGLLDWLELEKPELPNGITFKLKS